MHGAHLEIVTFHMEIPGAHCSWPQSIEEYKFRPDSMHAADQI